MLFQRHKILLGLIEAFGGFFRNTDLQKDLFLFVNIFEKTKKSYYFIPYKFGCYSFQSYGDKIRLINAGYLKKSKNWEITNKFNSEKELTSEQIFKIKEFKKLYGSLKGEELVKYIYINYPYYAINSIILNKIVDQQDIEKVNNSRPKNSITALYTIGYEGIFLEEYINKLIKQDIKILIDVRKNPFSMKYGFSKNILKKSLDNVGIIYDNLDELGVESENRQNLKTQADYNFLFLNYKIQLKNKINYLNNLYKNIMEYKRVAITCFEADYKKCHRSILAKEMSILFRNKFKVINL